MVGIWCGESRGNAQHICARINIIIIVFKMSSPLPKATTKKKKENDANDTNKNKKQKKVAAAPIPEIIPRDALESADEDFKDNNKKCFTAVAFNVAGLRAVLKNKPECLRKIVDETKCDALMFSEHKLNPENVEEATRQLKALLPEFTTVKFACSTAKKGYAGVCVLAKSECEEANARTIKKEGGKSPMKQTSIKDMFGGGASEKKKEAPTPTNNAARRYDGPRLLKVTEGLLDGKHLSEGRAITLEYESFNALFTYVPNSGQKLDRLDWRINTWEKECREHLNALQAKKPTIYGGDLNVAHLDIDLYNVDAKHIPKSAGTTPEERNAFGVMTRECDMKDAFRYFNPGRAGGLRIGLNESGTGQRIEVYVWITS